MLPQQKQSIVISQVSTTNAETASGNVDTLGFDFLTLDVITSTSDAVSNNPSVLKLAESDDTETTNFADVSGFVGDTDFTIPDSATAGTWGVKFNVDLRPRKRYLKLSISPLTTQVITAIANLSRGDEAPTGTTSANVTALIEG
jgi:hypothetical protein